MKTLKEQIEVMQHFNGGGEVEAYFTEDGCPGWYDEDDPSWNWFDYDFRIKLPKKTVTIEKWLTYNKMYDAYNVLETSKIDVMGNSLIEKVKLLDSYDVEVELCD